MKKVEKIIVPNASMELIPRTTKSYPMNAADRQVDPIDLSKYGFVEEEYYVSGMANVYDWINGQLEPVIRSENCPYVTRIIVRKPKNSSDFSGHVLCEMMHGAGDLDNPTTGWGSCFEDILKDNDAYVGITVSGTSYRTLKKFDSERYSRLALNNPLPPEERGPRGNCAQSPDQLKVNRGGPQPDDPSMEKGLDFDMVSQIAATIKRGPVNTPFYGYKVNYVYLTGVTFAEIPVYVASIQPYSTLDGNRKVFDGFIIYLSGRAANINRERGALSWDDPRSKCNADVPVIRIQTAGDLRGTDGHPFWAMMWRSENSDEPGNLGRWYEVAGSSLKYMGRTDKIVYPCQEDIRNAGLSTDTDFMKNVTIHDTEPLRFAFMPHIIAGAYHNLKLWVEKGISAPVSNNIKIKGTYPDAEFIFDEFGNEQGGIRNPYVDVPIAKYLDNGEIIPLGQEKITALYKTKEDYLEKVRKCLTDLVMNRWILERSADELYQEISQIDWEAIAK